MKDRKDFYDKTSHYNYRAERQAGKTMGLTVSVMMGETGHQDQQADDHQLIFLSKG